MNMGLFDFIRHSDINEGIKEYQSTPNAVLIDVRRSDEFTAGHIEGSINVPLADIGFIEEKIPDLDTQLFIYCLSGARSSNAAAMLKEMGYTNAKSIGGINSFKGTLVK